MKNNIFKLQPELDYYAYEDESITLMSESIDYKHIEALFKGDSLHKLLIKYIDECNLTDNILKDYNDYNDYADVSELLESEELAEVMDYIAYSEGVSEEYLIDELLTNIGYQFGTVGYSQWSYFTSPDTYSYDYIRDYWEGWNFYSLLQLDEQGKIIDSIGGLYLTDEGQLMDYISGYFEYDGTPYIVDNESSSYFNVTKVREVVTCTSEFEVI